MDTPPRTVNGLNPAELPPIAFVDCDGVIFEEGTDRLLPGAAAGLRALAATHTLVFFTARSLGSWVDVVDKLNIPGKAYYLGKPLGCAYTFVDDRLLQAAHSLAELGKKVESSPIWKLREAEEAELNTP